VLEGKIPGGDAELAPLPRRRSDTGKPRPMWVPASSEDHHAPASSRAPASRQPSGVYFEPDPIELACPACTLVWSGAGRTGWLSVKPLCELGELALQWQALAQHPVAAPSPARPLTCCTGSCQSSVDTRP
jgi:hypothetical protein